MKTVGQCTCRNVFLSQWIVLSIGFVISTRGALSPDAPAEPEMPHQRCEDISIPMCKGIGYNQTSMPNPFNHETQDEAGMEVHQFWPLVEIQCSEDLRFFLCSLYTPICMEEYAGTVPACRSVCQRARSGCAPIMQQYGFAWPERMNCDHLPEYGDQDNLCMDSKEGMKPDVVDVSAPSTPTKSSKKTHARKGGAAKGKQFAGGKENLPRFTMNEVTKPPKQYDECMCVCRAPMVNTSDPHLNRHVASLRTPECALPCRNMYFNVDDQTFAHYWISTWAILCCVSTTITVFTFLIDTSRFQYPERPIIFLSFCYLMVSVGYLLRIARGHEEVACDGNIVRYSIYGRPPACLAVFILTYFFGMASSMWWVILTLTWLLASGLKWGNEAIAACAKYFHLIAWSIPAAKTTAALGMNVVDGDSVAGLCYIGNQHAMPLTSFVLIPLCAYLILGSCLLLAGFVSLVRIRNVIRAQERAKADKLEKLMIRIGIFSVLYTVPAATVIGCYVYEQYYRDGWLRRLACPCALHDITPRPHFYVFMVKYFMCLVVGITSGFWIWSGKTVESWCRFYGRLCTGSRAHPATGGVVGDFPDPHIQAFKQSMSPVISQMTGGHLSTHSSKTIPPLSHV